MKNISSRVVIGVDMAIFSTLYESGLMDWEKPFKLKSTAKIIKSLKDFIGVCFYFHYKENKKKPYRITVLAHF